MISQRSSGRNFLLRWLLPISLLFLAAEAYGRKLSYISGIARDSAYVQVYVRFTVPANTGAIEDVHIIKTVKHCNTCSNATVGACEQEALRVVKEMPPWKKSGKNKKVILDLPMKFLMKPKD